MSIFMANASPFMNLNKANMIPQPKNVLESNFPTFDNLLFTVPKKKGPDDIPLNEQKQFNFKMQILEEKLKNSESKRMLLETINKNFLLDEEKKIAEKLKERDKLDPNTFGLKAVEVLKDIRQEIVKKLEDEGFKNRETFSLVDNKIEEIKSDITNKFNKLHHRQMMQLESLKYILEHSGSSRLKNLTKRILGEEFYDVTQITNKFVKPSHEELDQAFQELNKISSKRGLGTPKVNTTATRPQILNSDPNLINISENDDDDEENF